ncbi:MAG TPA: sigma-70 family RNA polymerase sigma factor, partial [Chitinophagaceae bacterium]|nr:sigma-70 family RNA polymerase sigma factor [Chitinophagaceae bacterium]
EYSLNGWLLQVTKNFILDGLKKTANDRKLQDKLLERMNAFREHGMNSVIEKELERIRQGALDSLTPQQKIIFTLSREEELSYEQIAERLGLSKNTVRNQMTAALRTIREYLSDHPDIAFILLLLLSGENNFKTL